MTFPFETLRFTGSPAVRIGQIDLQPKEMLFYLYLPIKMIDSGLVEIPANLMIYKPLIDAAMHDYQMEIAQAPFSDIHARYIYLTAKRLFVTPDNIGNRPGWHCDGFGTDDINYIWTDKYPTVFSGGEFLVRTEDALALEDLEAQAKPEDEYTYDINSLIRIDSLCPHRTPSITESGLRTFVKISISRHRYNLEGNSHNYLFYYDWTLHERGEIRNMENKEPALK